MCERERVRHWGGKWWRGVHKKGVQRIWDRASIWKRRFLNSKQGSIWLIEKTQILQSESYKNLQKVGLNSNPRQVLLLNEDELTRGCKVFWCRIGWNLSINIWHAPNIKRRDLPLLIHLSSSSTNPLTRTFSPFSTKVCLIYEENFVLSRFKVDLTLNFYESEHFNLLILCNLGPAPRMTFCVVMLRSLRFRNPVVPASMNPYTSCFCEWTLLCTDLKHKQECVRHHIFIPTQEEVDRVSKGTHSSC